MSSLDSFKRWDAAQKAKVLALHEEDPDAALVEYERWQVLREKQIKAMRNNLKAHLLYRTDEW